MEAKDTVMNDKQLARAFGSYGDELVASDWDLHCEDDLRNVAEAQAEISFKAGIREVVEWIEEQNFDILKGWDDDASLATHQRLKFNPKWQGRKKAWGVDKPKK